MVYYNVQREYDAVKTLTENTLIRTVIKMYKLKMILLIIPIICNISSCSTKGGRLGMIQSDNKTAALRMEQVVEVINNEDVEAIKALFSQKALDETEDFEGNAAYLFDFIDGTIDTWEKPSGPTVFESIQDGNKVKEIHSYYLVNTENQEYFFLLVDYPVDTDHPENVGLYTLLVVREEDHYEIYDKSNKIIYDGDKKLTHAGIYLPIE